MARQRRPDKAPAVEQPTPLNRAAKLASDWRAIVGLIVMLCGGVAFALGIKFATKSELENTNAHVAAHDVTFAGFKQALDDIRETVHQIHDDQHQENLTHR